MTSTKSRYYSDIFLEGLRKTTKKFSRTEGVLSDIEAGHVPNNSLER